MPLGEPLLKLPVGLADVRHEEVQTPQLHQVVVERRARQQEAMLADGIQQGLPSAQTDINCLISFFGRGEMAESHMNES